MLAVKLQGGRKKEPGPLKNLCTNIFQNVFFAVNKNEFLSGNISVLLKLTLTK